MCIYETIKFNVVSSMDAVLKKLTSINFLSLYYALLHGLANLGH